MALYFFDIITDGILAPDLEGMVLPNMDAARRKASRALANLARGTGASERLPKLTVSVRTSEGPVFETALKRALQTTH
jgi:hypothetical protein